jgi:predicted transcriptional regulator
VIYENISDHFPTYLNIDLQHVELSVPANVCKRSYQKVNYDSFVHSIKTINWNPLMEKCRDSGNADLLYNDFHDIILDAFIIHFLKLCQQDVILIVRKSVVLG